jgi:peptide/nickel transport system permease protein
MRVVGGLALRALVTLTGTAMAAFALLWHAPGDPALAIALARCDAQVPGEVLERIRAEAGLDMGFWKAFRAWIGPLPTGDLGNSSVKNRPVGPDLAAALGHTMPLALDGLAIGVALAAPLCWLATRRLGGWLDRGAMATASLGAAVPQYWLGPLLIVLFSVQLDWLPAKGEHAILPALTLGRGVAVWLTRVLRSGLLGTRGQPFLPALRRRGVSAEEIGRAHIIAHAAIPVVTVFGLKLAFLLVGAVTVEVILARPGFGSFLVEAILTRDSPKVQAVVLLAALLFVTVNLAIDLIYRGLDPRIGDRDA